MLELGSGETKVYYVPSVCQDGKGSHLHMMLKPTASGHDWVVWSSTDRRGVQHPDQPDQPDQAGQSGQALCTQPEQSEPPANTTANTTTNTTANTTVATPHNHQFFLGLQTLLGRTQLPGGPKLRTRASSSQSPAHDRHQAVEHVRQVLEKSIQLSICTASGYSISWGSKTANDGRDSKGNMQYFILTKKLTDGWETKMKNLLSDIQFFSCKDLVVALLQTILGNLDTFNSPAPDFINQITHLQNMRLVDFFVDKNTGEKSRHMTLSEIGEILCWTWLPAWVSVSSQFDEQCIETDKYAEMLSTATQANDEWESVQATKNRKQKRDKKQQYNNTKQKHLNATSEYYKSMNNNTLELENGKIKWQDVFKRSFEQNGKLSKEWKRTVQLAYLAILPWIEVVIGNFVLESHTTFTKVASQNVAHVIESTYESNINQTDWINRVVTGLLQKACRLRRWTSVSNNTGNLVEMPVGWLRKHYTCSGLPILLRACIGVNHEEETPVPICLHGTIALYLAEHGFYENTVDISQGLIHYTVNLKNLKDLEYYIDTSCDTDLYCDKTSKFWDDVKHNMNRILQELLGLDEDAKLWDLTKEDKETHRPHCAHFQIPLPQYKANEYVESVENPSHLRLCDVINYGESDSIFSTNGKLWTFEGQEKDTRDGVNYSQNIEDQHLITFKIDGMRTITMRIVQLKHMWHGFQKKHEYWESKPPSAHKDRVLKQTQDKIVRTKKLLEQVRKV